MTGRKKVIHSASKVRRERARALSELRTAAKNHDMTFDEDFACIVHGDEINSLPTVCGDANVGYQEDEVKALGKYANRLGLDGLSISKWFLRIQELHDSKVLKRLSDAVNKDQRVSVMRRAREGVKVTVKIGENTFTHYMTRNETITIQLGPHNP